MRVGNSDVSTKMIVGNAATAMTTPVTTSAPAPYCSGTSVDIRGLLASLNGLDAVAAFHSSSCDGNSSSSSGNDIGRIGIVGQQRARTTLPVAAPGTMHIATADVQPADGCSGDEAVVAAGACSSPTRKSANMTERVAVPSSEHVAEIVGRQGK